jgi:hypothetical protein
LTLPRGVEWRGLCVHQHPAGEVSLTLSFCSMAVALDPCPQGRFKFTPMALASGEAQVAEQ